MAILLSVALCEPLAQSSGQVGVKWQNIFATMFRASGLNGHSRRIGGQVQ
ncbi:MAG: hypothetical protein NT013_13815 [Planctomycetia bacterium]|nr:hypothetical protein [Planctomycetia bacterium]